jgi:hypothetical protein
MLYRVLPVVQDKYDIQTHWQDMRAKYNEYTARFANQVNEVRPPVVSAQDFQKETFFNVQVGLYRFRKALDACGYAKEVARTVHDGFKLLSEWTCRILEMSAWKFTHPCPPSKLEELGAKLGNPGIEYERVIRCTSFCRHVFLCENSENADTTSLSLSCRSSWTASP